MLMHVIIPALWEVAMGGLWFNVHKNKEVVETLSQKKLGNHRY
jgi:hypothetical protein